MFVWAAAAQAATVVSPANGEEVSSRPTFAFDFTNGTAEIELSRSPDVKTAGDEAGEFVDRHVGIYAVLYMREPRDGLAPWNEEPLVAGRYYWHVRTRDDGTGDFSGTMGPWQQTMTLTVRDEPPVLEGWTLTARRLPRRRNCDGRTISLTGRVAFADNAERPAARYTLTLASGSKRLLLRGRFSWIDDRYAHVVCVRGRSATVTPTLRDPGGHLVVGDKRRVRLP